MCNFAYLPLERKSSFLRRKCKVFKGKFLLKAQPKNFQMQPSLPFCLDDCVYTSINGKTSAIMVSISHKILEDTTVRSVVA